MIGSGCLTGVVSVSAISHKILTVKQYDRDPLKQKINYLKNQLNTFNCRAKFPISILSTYFKMKKIKPPTL